MSYRPGPRRPWLALLLAGVLGWSSTLSGFAAGVTIVTHGLNSNVDDWVIAMASRMAGYPAMAGRSSTCYELYFVSTNSSYALTWKRLSGSAPTSSDSGEIFVKLDWRQLANNSYSTFDVANLVTPRLLETNFISELNGHALAELPMHLVGHSRGGSLMCQISRLLGTNGVWVDHLTTLDPHPLNNDGFFDFIYTVVDAPAHTYENVLFHDNYFQTINVLFNGEPIAGAYTRELKNLDGGYSDLSAAHSNVHLWYHGTADLRVPADDTVASITANQRRNWWTTPEAGGAQAGFLYSRIVGGDRRATAQPAGSGHIRDGYNQLWDFGAGVANNRTTFAVNGGLFPNPIQLQLSGTNQMSAGQSNAAVLHYQWAKPASANAQMELFLDPDGNAFNGNETLLQQVTVPGTTSQNVQFGTLTFTPNNAVGPGDYNLGVRMVSGGSRRYLYTTDRLSIRAESTPPRLTIGMVDAQGVRIDVQGRAGQNVILEGSIDFFNWTSLATNPATGYFESISAPAGVIRAFRARVQ